MSANLPFLDYQRALREFLSAQPAQATYLGNRGGFSGASIWRVEAASRVFCLKAWPQSPTDPNQFERMHAWMLAARQAGLGFIPRVHLRADGGSWVRVDDRFWDLTSWMPGTADFHTHPSIERLTAAAVALGQVHAAWQQFRSYGECPSIERRLEALADWNRMVSRGWRLSTGPFPDPEWTILLQRAGHLVSTLCPRLEAMLSSWRQRPVPLQACIGDFWHDHVLFQGEAVSGLIDFGSVRIDHPASDLGRLLGSLVGDDDSSWAKALSAYRSVRPFPWEAEALARLLDRTGVMVSLINWLRWCGDGERSFSDPAAVTQRLGSLVERVEGWQKRTEIVGE